MKSGSMGLGAQSNSSTFVMPSASDRNHTAGPGRGPGGGDISLPFFRLPVLPGERDEFGLVPSARETYFTRARRPFAMRKPSLRFATRAVRGRRRNPPIATPIHASSVWTLESSRQGAAFAKATAPPAYYARWGNPTVRDLEDTLADLEGGARGLATASGMGAIASAIPAL